MTGLYSTFVLKDNCNGRIPWDTGKLVLFCFEMILIFTPALEGRFKRIVTVATMCLYARVNTIQMDVCIVAAWLYYAGQCSSHILYLYSLVEVYDSWESSLHWRRDSTGGRQRDGIQYTHSKFPDSFKNATLQIAYMFSTLLFNIILMLPFWCNCFSF